jgi:hypothetical protein
LYSINSYYSLKKACETEKLKELQEKRSLSDKNDDVMNDDIVYRSQDQFNLNKIYDHMFVDRLEKIEFFSGGNLDNLESDNFKSNYSITSVIRSKSPPKERHIFQKKKEEISFKTKEKSIPQKEIKPRKISKLRLIGLLHDIITYKKSIIFDCIRKKACKTSKMYSKVKRRSFIYLERVLATNRLLNLSYAFKNLNKNKSIAFIDLANFKTMLLLTTVQKTVKKYDMVTVFSKLKSNFSSQSSKLYQNPSSNP